MSVESQFYYCTSQYSNIDIDKSGVAIYWEVMQMSTSFEITVWFMKALYRKTEQQMDRKRK